MIIMTKTNNYETLTVKELKELCRKAGIKGYSRMKKAELIDALNNNKELKKAIITEARANAKNELGQDFGKAVSFWKQLRNLKYLSANDYADMVDNWKILIGLFHIAEAEGTENRTLTDSLVGTAETLRDIFCPNADISGYSDDELKAFIESSIEEFSLSVFSKRLKKENTEIIKMSMDHILFNEQGVAYFDSTKASKFTGKEVRVHKTDMRIVESSEDGISRMLMEKGLSSITVFMGKTAQGEEEMKLIEDAKKNIFRNGFWDVATNKHYMFAFQNPSSCRKANFMFVEAKDWNEVVTLWLEITGLKDWDDFKRAFFDKEGKVIMAKLLARISTRGSNSFNLSKISPVWAEKIAKANIRYCKDAEWTINRPFKTMKGPGCMELQEGVERIVTPGDGQMIGSFEFHALMSVALRVISENEYTEFSMLWDRAGKDIKNVNEGSRLYKLIKKIPGVFQLRHGEKKGICVRYNLEAIDELKDVNAIVPDSVRKFVAGEWHEFPLEICNYLKKKDKWVALNPQFIQALDYENPNALNKIVKFWFDYMKESLSDHAKAQQFHGIIKNSDDDDNRTIASNLVTAMRTSSDLIDDAQICNWRKDQYRKFISDMKIGRILVPGQYTYMVCDPAFIISKVFGIDLPHLAEGEYYHNGKECNCGLFRSPLIHPFEAQKVQLFNNEAYWYMQDVIVFNGYDGAWDRMGGGDFDGDTCAVIPDDTEFGKTIVDGIRCLSFDVWEEAQKAVKKEFNMHNFIEYLVTSAKVDRTGIITNENTKSMDISNHLKASVYFAKYYNCENVTLLDPRLFGKSLGCDFVPQTMVNNGVKTFAIKGFLEAKMDNRTKQITFDTENALIGTFSFEEILEKAEYYLSLVEIGRILQGREIDGAKTGVYAEGVSGNDYIDAVKTKFTPHQMIVRQETLDREVSESSQLNKYVSVSTLGRIHDYVCLLEPEIMDYLENGSNKIFLLQSLLTEEEAEIINKPYLMQDGTYKNLVEIMAIRKKAYNTKIYDTMKNLTGDDASNTLKEIKAVEIDDLNELATALNIGTEVIAVASYIATYTKDSKQNEGLTYAWLLFDELLSVFSRGNKKFELFKLPEFVESAYIFNKMLYINGNEYRKINAYDCTNVVVQIINSRTYGLIHKIVDKVATPRKSNIICNDTIYTIGTLGFKYHIAGENPKEEWKKIIAEHNDTFDITMDATNRAVLSVLEEKKDENGEIVKDDNGETVFVRKSISALMSNASFDLMNKKVKIVNPQTSPFEETNASIKNIQVIIIGEAK